MLRINALCLVVLLMGLVHPTYAEQSNTTLTVFAAASLAEPLEEFGTEYTRSTNIDVRFSFAASSSLARQIDAGAQPQLFISANTIWMDYLAERFLIDIGSRSPLLTNTIVIAAPAASPLTRFELTSSSDLLALLAPGERIAMGDPEHVPAGMYALTALNKLGLWDKIAPFIARADNTRAALALIERGEAPFGFVYLTDVAISGRVKIIAQIPASAHPEIRYDVALLKPGNFAAVDFLNTLKQPQSLKLFLRYGFRPYKL